jgi:hypothetical protein
MRGGIHVGSIYLRDSEGLSAENMTILGELAIAIKQLSGPWFFGGDFNIPPDVLLASGWLGLVGGSVVAPTNPTCHGSVYDYFVVSSALLPAVLGAQRVEEAELSPHSPARILLRVDARRAAVRRLVRPPHVHGSLPFGPLPEPPAFDVIGHDISAPADIDAAVAAWHLAVRQQLGSLLPRAPPATADNVRPYFRWEPALGRVARTALYATTLSVTWRGIGHRARELAATIAHPPPGTSQGWQDVLIAHRLRRAATTARDVIARQGSPEDAADLVRAVSALGHIVAARAPGALETFSRAAFRKADVVDGRVARENSKRYRGWLGVSGATVGGPSRAAYRWIAAPAGWTSSPVGKLEDEDTIPEADDDGVVAFDDVPGVGQDTAAATVPLSDQASVNLESEKWIGEWAGRAAYTNPSFVGAAAEQLPAWCCLLLASPSPPSPRGRASGMTTLALGLWAGSLTTR